MAAGSGSSVYIRMQLLGQSATARGIREVNDEIQKLGGNVKVATKLAAGMTKIGLAAQGLAAGGAGAVALTSGLAPLSGLAAAGANSMIALKTSMGLVKLAGTGLSASFKGVFDQFQQATPATNALAKQVSALVPQLLHVRNIAQTRILGGVQDGLKAATPLIGQLTPALARTSTALGGLAASAGRAAVSLGPQLGRILNSNVAVIRNFGHAGIDAGSALIVVLDAARPLTTWLSGLVRTWASLTLETTKSGAASGALATFFARTQQVAAHLFSIIGSLATAFFNVGKAAYPLGHDILVGIDKAAAAMARWTATASGQQQITAFFDRARPVLASVWKLVLAVGKAFFSLSSGTQLAPLIDEVTRLVPVLADIVKKSTAAFGPRFAQLIHAVTDALGPLGSSTGALGLYIDLLTGFAKAIAWAERNIPGFTQVLIGLVTAFGAVRVAMGIAAIFGAMSAAISAVTASTALWTIATTAVAGAIWLVNAALAVLTSPITLVIVAIAAIAAGLYLLYQKSETFRAIVNAVWGFISSHWALLVSILAMPLAPILLLIQHFGTVKSVVMSVVNFITGLWPTLTAIFYATPLGWVISHFNQIRSAASSALGFIISKVTSVVSAIQSVVSAAAKLGAGLWGAFKSGAMAVIQPVIDLLQGVVDKVGEVKGALDSVAGAVGIHDYQKGQAVGGIKGVPARAAGGLTNGLTLVGERGPELVNFGSTSRVFSNADTRSMISTPRVAAPTIDSAPTSGGGRGDSARTVYLLLDPKGRDVIAEIVDDRDAFRTARGRSPVSA